MSYLYQQTFGEHIDGVIFVNDKLFSLLLPEYEYLKTRRQFQNVYADTLSQRSSIVKKAQTFDHMSDLISRSRLPELLYAVLNHLQDINQHRLIQRYIPSVST